MIKPALAATARWRRSRTVAGTPISSRGDPAREPDDHREHDDAEHVRPLLHSGEAAAEAERKRPGRSRALDAAFPLGWGHA